MEAQREPPARAESPESPRAREPSASLLGWRSASDLLGPWNFYFIAKLLLFWRGLIGFHLLENLALAVALAVPLASSRWRRIRHAVAAPVAVALLYHDSWLPGASRVIEKAGLVSGFSAAYLAELAGRFVSVPVVALLAVAAAIYFVLARFVRMDAPVIAAMLALPLLLAAPRPQEGGGASAAIAAAPERALPTPDAQLEAFFRKEAPRAVTFPRPPEGSAPFDVVLLHVCSLSWDDLQATGQERHPLLGSFDIVLGRFNSASTYSGPSVIRFLRAPCGQVPQGALYAPAPEGCLLAAALEGAGFETNLVLNHDGHFDDFLSYVRKQGVKAPVMPLKGIPAPQRSFDESQIHDDEAVLARWLESRGKSPAARVAAIYNTVSLHDGNRLVADPKTNSRDTYKARQVKLLGDLEGFMKKLEAGKRPTVVILVPEHGAAVRGDAAQISGLREIPTPAITRVPVGIRVLGPGARRVGEPVRIDEPTSYLAMSHILSRMLAKPPFGAGGFRPAEYVAGLPGTDFVAESEAAVVQRYGEKYLWRQGKEAWRELPASPGLE